jgi:Protein of unknown function (DUF1460)
MWRFSASFSLFLLPSLALRAGDSSGDPIAVRIESLSAQYIGVPYLLDPLGEGAEGSVDRDPLVRFDRFDCQTFVETVIAQARSHTKEEFSAELIALRYRNGKIGFSTRNHFPDADWIPNNVARGVLVELSGEVAGANALGVATTRITRRAWFLNLARNPTQAHNDYLRTHTAAQAALRAMAATAVDEEAVVRYVSKAMLGDPTVLARVPSGAIVFVVRPHSSMLGPTGSLQNIAHFGFAIRSGGRLLFRHASSGRAQAVVDEPLASYIERLSHSRSFAGVAIYGVVP